ncbi:Zinc finger MYND domain-containing protein [Drosera capensis]
MECAAKGRGSRCIIGPSLRRCARCDVVAYCSLSHQLSHWSDHKEECGRLEQHMKSVNTLNDFCFTFDQQGPSSPLSKQLSSWKEYYEWRNIPLDSPVALLLHWPLTIYHAMQMASCERVSARATRYFKIHYLGPERELFQLAVFAELLALLPSYEMHIDFVGPAVPQQRSSGYLVLRSLPPNCGSSIWQLSFVSLDIIISRDGEKITLYSYAHCDYEDCECKMARKNTSLGASIEADSAVTLRLFRGLYHNRFRDMDSSPDLIIAPNAGIAAYRSWLATIELIKGLDAPAVFSDFCEEAAHLAARCLSNVFDSTLTLPIQLNPFRHPLAVEDSALRLPCYSNCYIFGI